MVKVSYSTEILEYKIFLDVISRFVRLGWHGVGPIEKDDQGRDGFIYISFHTHPEDADKLDELLQKVITSESFFCFKRSRGNRFSICSKKFNTLEQESENFSEALEKAKENGNSLSIQTATQIKLLSDLLYEKIKSIRIES